MKRSLSPTKADALAGGTEVRSSICPFGFLPAWLLLRHLREQLPLAALLVRCFTGPPQEAGNEVGKQFPELLSAPQDRHYLRDGTGDLHRNIAKNHLFRKAFSHQPGSPACLGQGGSQSTIATSVTVPHTP